MPTPGQVEKGVYYAKYMKLVLVGFGSMMLGAQTVHWVMKPDLVSFLQRSKKIIEPHK